MTVMIQTCGPKCNERMESYKICRTISLIVKSGSNTVRQNQTHKAGKDQAKTNPKNTVRSQMGSKQTYSVRELEHRGNQDNLARNKEQGRV